MNNFATIRYRLRAIMTMKMASAMTVKTMKILMRSSVRRWIKTRIRALRGRRLTTMNLLIKVLHTTTTIMKRMEKMTKVKMMVKRIMTVVVKELKRVRKLKIRNKVKLKSI